MELAADFVLAMRESGRATDRSVAIGDLDHAGEMRYPVSVPGALRPARSDVELRRV